MAKTKKRPSRIYGGMLCSKCSREVLKQKARVSK
jgi:ribosomal protein L34E